MTTVEAERTDTETPERKSVMVNMPFEMATQLTETAERANQSVSSFCRQVLAEHIGYTGPLARESRGPRRKYETPEERKAALNARNKAKRDFIKDLLTKYNADEELARIEAEAEREAIEQVSN